MECVSKKNIPLLFQEKLKLFLECTSLGDRICYTIFEIPHEFDFKNNFDFDN